MATRKDQLHSYQFMMQRVISSVMLRETDPEQTPLRKGVGAVFGGVMLTGLLAIAFGVYGVISGNIGNRWQVDGAIIIERETGAHYLYEDGVLQPVLNYASARLLADAGDAKRVPGRNLAGIPRRTPIGIPGAPDSLPPLDRAAGTPWTLCSALPEDPSGSPFATTVLLVGGDISGSTPLAEQALLVRDFDDDSLHLVWRSHRYQIGGDDPDQVVRSMYGFQAQIVLAGTAWLNGLPAGPELAPVDLDDRGEESEAIDDYLIGDVLFHPVADGLTDGQIAERLYISSRTAGNHLRSIYKKLGVPSRAAAVRQAIERVLI
jgi:type VII secretion protein EccB